MSKYLEESYNEALRENLALIEQNKMLLAKLEMAEKVLEKLSIQMPGSRDNELVLHREQIASEALKQIRE